MFRPAPCEVQVPDMEFQLVATVPVTLTVRVPKLQERATGTVIPTI